MSTSHKKSPVLVSHIYSLQNRIRLDWEKCLELAQGHVCYGIRVKQRFLSDCCASGLQGENVTNTQKIETREAGGSWGSELIAIVRHVLRKKCMLMTNS